MLSHLSLRQLLVASVAALAILAGGLSVAIVLGQMDVLARVGQGEMRLATVRALADIPRTMLPERGTISLASQVALLNGQTYGDMQVAKSVQALRDVGGREAGMLQTIVGRAAPPSRDLQDEQWRLMGQVIGIWSDLEATAGSMDGTAGHTRDLTQKAAAAVEAGGGLQTVAAAAEELSASIREISQQVSQTATVSDEAVAEAARAGDAGKGFAVVASEVKNLAAQTSRATEDIGAQITAIQAATAQVVRAIKGISTRIESMNVIASSIASAVEEQGAATAEIARNVQTAAQSAQTVTDIIAGMSEAANDTGSSSRKLMAAATTLSRQTVELSGEVDRFISGVRAA